MVTAYDETLPLLQRMAAERDTHGLRLLAEHALAALFNLGDDQAIARVCASRASLLRSAAPGTKTGADPA